MIREYLIQEKLGIGSYGTVYKVTKKNSNNIDVIKQISLFGLTQEEIKDVELEAKILYSIKSPYVVRYFDSFEEKNFLNIVMEYCDGGDLGKFIEEKKSEKEYLNEDLIWILFIKITLGLAAIHKLKILHRDLKTLNIFLTKDLDVKIGDLGVAKILSHSGCFAKTLIGTPYYLSPELCEEKPYNDKSDIWALGCILYELCTYKHPFNAKSQGGLILKILESEPAPIGNNYSNDLQTLINNIFEKKMEKRPSCQDILKNSKIIDKAKKLELFDKITDLYPELKENNKQNNPVNLIMNNKIIYNKNRYPRNYKIKNNLQKNNSFGNIVISNNNIQPVNNRNINIYKKNNKAKYKNQFNSISTDSRSHNSIKNIFKRNNEKEPKDNQRSNNSKNINGGNIINNQNNNNKINKLFVKKPLNKSPLSALNKKINNQNNGRYINIEKDNKYNNISKAVKSINTSSKSAKKFFINLNNNSKVNLIKNGIVLRTNKIIGKKFFIAHKTNNGNENENKTQNNEISNNNYTEYLNDKSNFDINNDINNNIINNNYDIKPRNTNIINNNFKEKIDDKFSLFNNDNQNKLDLHVNESIEKFENRLKNYYQFSPEVKSKRITYINNQKNPLQTPNKEIDFLFKLTPIDIIDNNNNNKDLINIAGKEYNKNTHVKTNHLMEFVKNLNEYVPQYKINNQIPKSYKRNKSKSKSVCENDSYNNIQNQVIYQNRIINGEKNNNFFINKINNN